LSLGGELRVRTINMLSSATRVKGQGVASAFIEQTNLVVKGLSGEYEIIFNRPRLCDIMHYHTVDLKHYLMIPFARKKGVNVGYVHFLPETIDDSLSFPPLIRKMFYRYIISFYMQMDYLVTVNPYFIDKLVEYGIPRDKITYIPNFVSEAHFYPYDSEEKIRKREEYGFDSNSFIVLGAGQVQTRKGVEDFIETAKILDQFQFVWAGGFSFGRITAGYENLKKIMENPPDNVRFLGIVDRSKMRDLYNISDVLFLPSYQELFPMTVLEAFNCRLPVLLRDLDVYPGIFHDFYLKGKTVNDFAEILKRLAEDKEFLEKWQEQSWKGHDMYSEANVLKMWKDFYGMIIRNHSQER